MNLNLEEDIGKFMRSLYRDSENGWLLGVCAGLADRFEVNVSGVRVLVAVMTFFFTVPTVIAYLALGILLRDRPLVYRGGADEQRFWSCRRERDGDGDSYSL